ncbi:MAG: hypothetical protein WKF31_02945 [Thermoleophilaceae bacterium]
MSRVAGHPTRGRARRPARGRRPAQLPLAPRAPERVDHPVRPPVPEPGSATLGERLDGAWESLAVSGRAECPVCRHPMESVGGVGQCGWCGSSLR